MPSNLMLSRSVHGQQPRGAAAQRVSLAELARERIDRCLRQLDEPTHPVAARGRLGVAFGFLVAPRRFSISLSRCRSASISRRAPLRVVEQVVLQVRIAPDDPDVAQHLEQHARRTAGATLAAQLVEDLPGVFAQQTDDDLAVGERRVVVRDLAEPDRRVRFGLSDVQGQGSVHRRISAGRKALRPARWPRVPGKVGGFVAGRPPVRHAGADGPSGSPHAADCRGCSVSATDRAGRCRGNGTIASARSRLAARRALDALRTDRGARSS
jgi:hypothetical protein